MEPLSGPEAAARTEIDAALEAAGGVVQNRDEINLSVAEGVAVRELKRKPGHGYADYLLFVDGKAVGVLEAKPPGHTLIGVEPQSTKYAHGLPDGLHPPITPLPFRYMSTRAVTKFTNVLDLEPRSGFIFHVPRQIAARDKCSLDLFWLRDESLEDSASLPDPHILAQEIADDLRSGQIEDIRVDLEVRAAKVPRQSAP